MPGEHFDSMRDFLAVYCTNSVKLVCTVSVICFCFFFSISFSTVEVLATLTSDVGRILSKMHLVQPKGNINLITGVRIAHVSIQRPIPVAYFA